MAWSFLTGVLQKWILLDRNIQPRQDSKRIENVADQTLFHPVIEEFRALIEDDPEIYMLVTKMFEEIPNKSPFLDEPTGQPRARDYHAMLRSFDVILTQAPEYNDLGMIGLPISALINWLICTKSGSNAFLNQKFNTQLGKVCREWGKFLSTEASTYVLNDTPKGWFCSKALDKMLGETADVAKSEFAEVFVCDPSKPHYGFRSWDSFFTREFHRGVRPVAAPDDESVVTNACESMPYRVVLDVREQDKFWIKEQNYSLQHMLANDPLTAEFVGGTVYQAYLSPESYHRWHSPVKGKVVKTKHQLGTLYSKLMTGGFDSTHPEDSQGYITAVATRAMIFIEAENPEIGLMCVVPVGWAEASSCEIIVKENEQVEKGQQLGMFHFGGSTHCLLFRPGVELKFDLHRQTPGPTARIIPVNSRIATVRTKAMGAS